MRSPTHKEKVRAASVEEIKEQLARGPMSAQALSIAVSVPRATLGNRLDYMHQTLRIARPTGRKIGHSPEWELGADPTLPSNEYREQIAMMRRDPLVAALFGPAHQ